MRAALEASGDPAARITNLINANSGVLDPERQWVSGRPPPAPTALATPRGRGRPVDPELPGREPYRQLERASRELAAAEVAG
jgi:hypothetical protein